MLIVFGGRPGSGKTTLSRTLAQELHAVWLRVDLIEAATWRAGVAQDQPTGLAAYSVAFALAEVHLDMGTPTPRWHEELAERAPQGAPVSEWTPSIRWRRPARGGGSWPPRGAFPPG